jgi:HSP20 family protein
MDRMIDENFMRPFGSWLEADGEPRLIALDVSETDEAMVVEASLPGMGPEEVDISVTGNLLTIKTERSQEKEQRKGNYHLRERRYGSMQRSIHLPTEVDIEGSEAVFEKGVLKLTLPKTESVKSKRIEIKTK